MARKDPARAVIDPKDRLGFKTEFIHRTQSAILDEELSRSPRAERALDFGCGNGRLTSLLARHAAHVVGVDSSEVFLASARAAAIPGRVEFVHYDGARLPFPPESFDLCLSVGVLQHIIRDAAHLPVIKELARTMKPGGRLVSIEQVRQRFGAAWRPRPSEYVEALESCGLRHLRSGAIRNGRDVLINVLALGLVPRSAFGLTARVEGLLARRTLAMPWTNYRDVLMVYEK